MKKKMLYKTCVCCGMTRSEDNFRRLSRSECRGVERKNWTSPVCMLCEKKGQPNKKSRIENLIAMKAKFKANEHARLEKQRKKELEDEFDEFMRKAKSIS